MENEKTLVFSLDINTDDGLKKAAEFRVAIDKDREALTALNKEIKAQGEATKEQLLQREKLEQSIRQNTQARNTELKTVDSYIKATKNATDAEGKSNQSRKQLQATLSFLTERWSGLTKAERENTEAGRALSREIKKVTEDLKEMEGGVGNTYRNVGNYRDAILDAAKGSGKFGDSINTLNDAFKVNPIGLLVTALTILPKLFESSGDSAGMFTGIMEQGAAVLNVFLDRAKFIGEAVSKLLKGDFSGAAEAAKKSYQGIGNELEREVKLSGELSKAKYQLERDEARNIATSKKLLNEIERLKNVRDNEFNSIQERNEANEKAFALEMKRQKTLEDLARRKLAIIQKEVDARGGATKASTEMIKELGEAEEALYDILEDSAGKQNELITNRFQLNQELKQQEEEIRQKRIKAFEEHRDQVRKEVEGFQKVIDGLADLRKAQLEEEKKARSEFMKTIDEQFQNSEKARQKELDANKQARDQEKKDTDERISDKEKVFQATVMFADATSNLSAMLAQENSDLAQFEKALALFRIGLATAEAYTQGVAKAQTVPFPGNILATAATVATIAGNLIQAKQIISGIGESPKYKAAEGGLLEGPSHAAGGIRGTGSFANVEVEGGEAIINKRSTSLFAPLLSAINQLGGGKPLGLTNYAAAGGLLPAAARSYAINQGGPAIDYDLLASKIARANESLPAPVVRPTEVIGHYNHRQSRIKKAGLGYLPSEKKATISEKRAGLDYLQLDKMLTNRENEKGS